MEIETVTATELQNNFVKFMERLAHGNQIVITKNGHEIGRIIPKDDSVSYLSDSLIGILKCCENVENIKDEELKRKYEIID